MKFKYANLNFTPKEINKEQRTLRAVFSTGNVDRHGEVVDQKSWILDDFLQNPVVLFGHDHSQPPVGKIVGLGYNEDGNLEGEVKFAADEYPFANVIWNLYREGFMKAFSVGFSAGKIDVVDGQVILKQNTLYEISTVSVPANAFALAKAKGIDVSSLENKIDEMLKASKKCADCEAEVEFEKECPCRQAKPEEVVEEAPAEEVAETLTIVDGEGLTANDSTVSLVVDGTAANTVAAAPEPGDITDVVDVAEEAAPTEEVEKSIADIITDVKEGRVLSKKNRKVLEDALVAIQAVLDTDGEKESKSISDDKIAAFIKVETPSIRVSVSNNTQNKAKLINKAIRALLAEKAKN